MKFYFPFLPILGVSLLASSLALAEGTTSSSSPVTAQVSSSYPLKNCVVSGDKLGGEMGAPVIEHYQGEEIQFCCKDCIKDFNKDPEKYLKKLHEEAAEAQAATLKK